jgi:predicted nucleic acid-binding protein
VILLDTNVISELARPEPSPKVVSWVTEHRHQLALSTVTVAELAYGVEILPDGIRRTTLRSLVERLVAAYANRMLAFTERTGWQYGEVMAQARSAGRTMSAPDGMIAAVAMVNGCDLATQNRRDFEILSLRLVDPWSGDP